MKKRMKTSASCKSSGCGKWRKGIALSKKHKAKISIATSGVRNPFWGKKHSATTKRKMSKNHADFSGNKNPYLRSLINDPLKRIAAGKRMSNIWKRRKMDRKSFKVYRQTISRAICKAHTDGKIRSYGRGHKHGYFTSIKQKIRIHYRSSYELRFLVWCENNIVNFGPCKLVIPYVDLNNKSKNYVPDFMINMDTIVEIKPDSMASFGNNPKKLKALKSFCGKHGYKYLWLTEKDLAQMGA